MSPLRNSRNRVHVGVSVQIKLTSHRTSSRKRQSQKSEALWRISSGRSHQSTPTKSSSLETKTDKLRYPSIQFTSNKILLLQGAFWSWFGQSKLSKPANKCFSSRLNRHTTSHFAVCGRVVSFLYFGLVISLFRRRLLTRLSDISFRENPIQERLQTMNAD